MLIRHNARGIARPLPGAIIAGAIGGCTTTPQKPTHEQGSQTRQRWRAVCGSGETRPISSVAPCATLHVEVLAITLSNPVCQVRTLPARTWAARVSLIRDCQPGPVARKASTISGAKRMESCNFFGAFCGPRFSRVFRNPEGSPEKGTAWPKSAAVNSRTSPRALVSGLLRFIASHFSGVGFAKTDYPNAASNSRIAQHMQPCIQVSDGDVARFTIVVTPVNEGQGGFEFKFPRALKRQIACTDVARIFC